MSTNKKIVSIILAIFISVFSFPASVSASSQRGDANSDGKINVRDAAFIASSIALGKELNDDADYNEDGKKNIRDAAAIVNDLTGGNKATTRKTSAQDVSFDERSTEMLELVNKERAKAGASPLTLNNTLINIANIRAKEIAQQFSHIRPNGKECYTVLSEKGIDYSWCGENIAAGASSVKSAFSNLKKSQGHYSNIIDSNYTHMGLGFFYDENSYYKYYWVQVFYGE